MAGNLPATSAVQGTVNGLQKTVEIPNNHVTPWYIVYYLKFNAVQVSLFIFRLANHMNHYTSQLETMPHDTLTLPQPPGWDCDCETVYGMVSPLFLEGLLNSRRKWMYIYPDAGTF